MQFSSFYPIEKFEVLHKNLQQKDINDAWREENRQLQAHLNQAILLFLGEKRARGELSLMENSEGHEGNFIRLWNYFVEQKPLKDYQQDELATTLIQKNLFFSTYQKPLQESYESITQRLDQGIFHRREMPDSEYCFGCGKHFSLQLNGWRMELLERHYDENKPLGEAFSYFPAIACEVEPIIQIDVEFHSGQVLVADWFRIDAFTTIVDEGVDFDINSDLGRTNQAKHYALKHNFVSIPAWRDAELFMKDEQIFALHNTSENQPEGYQSIGSHSLQLRAITLIDKQDLIHMLAKDSSLEQARETVNDYIEQEDVHTLDMSPGTYRFTFSGNHKEMAFSLNMEELKAFSPVFKCEKVVPTKKLKL